MTSSRIALDAMGGDDAPRATVLGALRASSATGGDGLDPRRLVLVGDREQLEAALAAEGGNPGFEIRHTSQVVGMGEKAAAALRQKPDSSIAGCVAAIRAGEAGAMVSMGNTGACVGAATLGLGTLEGVKRPGIAVTMEFRGRAVTVVDMGANIAPKPQHLYQYGVMGAVYARDVLGTAAPRIGLLNVGEEPGKGTDVLQEAHVLLSRTKGFVGNIEGGDLFQDVADVVVTDGFTGNVILKLLENFAGFLMELMMRELAEHDVTWGGEALRHIQKRIDYSEYGGALLLGVRGSVVIGHGRSDANAVANALRVAARAVDANVDRHIVQGLQAVPSS